MMPLFPKAVTPKHLGQDNTLQVFHQGLAVKYNRQHTSRIYTESSKATVIGSQPGHINLQNTHYSSVPKALGSSQNGEGEGPCKLETRKMH